LLLDKNFAKIFLMFKKILIYLCIVLGLIFVAGFVLAKMEKDSYKDGLADQEEVQVYNTNVQNFNIDSDGYQDGQEVANGFSPLKGSEAVLSQVTLSVPYINEAPDDNWVGPWKNACEDASMAMVENFYLGKTTVKISEAKNFMIAMFTRQSKLWGSNADADASRTARLINDYTVYNAIIKDNPTVEEIKKEIQQKRPVISLHYGFDLKNKNIPFVPAPRGSSYHMMVIIGYDDDTREFITNDTGDRITGKEHRYGYDLFINTLHDFIFTQRQANGPARVIFTYPKLVKLVDSPRVYYLHDNIKQYVTSPAVFTAKGWNWEAVNVVNEDWLVTFISGNDIKI
jgi:uncharacterized protein YvpB